MAVYKEPFGCVKKHVTFLPPLPGDAHENDSVGPALYKVEHKRTGTSGPKWSVANRHLEGVNAGHPNNLVQPVDTHGKGHTLSV